MAGEDDTKQAELHKTYFHTQADVAKVEKALPRYEKMKLVADYDRLQADAHPGDKRLESAAARSGKMAQTYYSNTIGGYVLARTDPDYRGEAERQGLQPLEPGKA